MGQKTYLIAKLHKTDLYIWGTSEERKPHSNLLYTDRLFHCYMLEDSICHLRGVGSILSLLFYF